MLLSIKKLEVCKVYLYYQILYELMSLSLPHDRGDTAQQMVIILNLINFCFNYLHFWPSTLSLLALQVYQILARSFVYGEPITAELVAFGVAGIIW